MAYMIFLFFTVTRLEDLLKLRDCRGSMIDVRYNRPERNFIDSKPELELEHRT
jgi:hypothetical protein